MTSAATARRAGRRTHGDNGSIVVGWLVRLAVLLTALAVGLFDAASVTVAHASLPDQARAVADAASESWQAHPDIELAYAAAVTSAREENAGNVVDSRSFRVDADGTAHVALTRTAQTYVLRHVDAARAWTRVSASGTAKAAD